MRQPRLPGPPPCLLIAEDNAEINALLAGAFREAGCEVLQAFGCVQAVLYKPVGLDEILGTVRASF